jgi:hypothetical protein
LLSNANVTILLIEVRNRSLHESRCICVKCTPFRPDTGNSRRA